MTFSEKLLTLRRDASLSQEKLAEALNVSRQAVSRWEQGTAMPDAQYLLFPASAGCRAPGIYPLSPALRKHNPQTDQADQTNVKKTASA
ncbi:MAG: helix-turn-helix transcriptional regulator [Clostridia bacterium]|nr:helix-turn-helix transcriptional regulator [Clostridia bacterium]